MVPDSASDRVKRRRGRLEHGLEDVLPHDTADDRPDALERLKADSEEHDRWLRDNRPPHHDSAW